MRDDTTRSRSAAADRPDDDASPTTDSLFGDLSDAAREAVRSPADPRLDAVLARMGLADAPEATPGATTAETIEPPAPPTRPEPAVAAVADLSPDPALEARQTALATEVERLRAAVAVQETAAAELRDRLRNVGMLAGGGVAVAVIALVLALIR